MKNVSTGFGLCVLGLGIAAWPVLDRLVPHANAFGVGTTAVTAVAAAATAQGDPPAPTVVWMGVNTSLATRETYGNPTLGYAYHRVWSDGKLERRAVHFRLESQATGCGSPSYRPSLQPCWDSGWIEVPPPPSGNGFACRGDLNGDRAVDGDDLGIMLAAWGQSPACNPDPTYACVGFGGGVAP